MPTAEWSTAGYFATRTAKFVQHDNSIGTRMYTVVTERGREMFHRLVTAEGRKPEPMVYKITKSA